MARLNMKAERIRSGLSVSEISKRVGMHPNTLRRWENGEVDPPAEKLVALAAIYRCTPEYLLDMTDHRNGRATRAKALHAS